MFAQHGYQELRRRLTRTTTCALLREPRSRSRPIDALSRTEIRRVLVCRPNHRLGNLLLLTPLLTELQHVFPGAEVDIVVAGEDGARVFRAFRNVRHIYSLSRRMVRHPLQTARIAGQIRRAKYDLAIVPCEGSQSSRWLVAIADATYVVGAHDREARPAAGAYPTPRHMATWPVHMLRQAIAPHGTSMSDEYPPLNIKLSPTEHLRGQQILRVLTAAGTSLPPVIGIFADATGAKRYPEAWWLRFIEAMRACIPVAMAVEIAPPDGHSRLSSRFPSFFSPDVREVAAVISRMACFISADCGVMHLAGASGVPTIGLFCATDASRYAPYGNGSRGIDTNGKSPEEVAALAGTVMAAVQAENNASVPARATGAVPTEAGSSLGAAPRVRRNIGD